MAFLRMICAFAIVFFVVACGQQTSTESTTIIKKDSVKIDSIKPEPTITHRAINMQLNDLGRYIAGLTPSSNSTLDSSLYSNPVWKNFSAALDKNWIKVDTTKIEKMKTWQETELAALKHETIFYPFAGADALNVYTLFPKAKTYIMVGLEPVGSLPDFKFGSSQDTLQRYFNAIDRSLYSIMNFSFFRTIAMKSDFHQSELDGTIHVNILFLERAGNSLIDVKPVNIKPTGELQTYTSFAEASKDTLRSKGVQIDFLDKDSVEHTLFYFSSNLANDGMKANPGFSLFVKKFNVSSTYLKSASYLMHKDYFSEVRNLILSHSKAVLGDDSGIPYRFYDSSWNITLYGMYNGAIPLFAGFYQQDYKQAFADSTHVKPLPFGIGYKYKLGESNLLLAVKKTS